MKKRKLVLARETVRALTPTRLARVAGGARETHDCSGSCWGSCDFSRCCDTGPTHYCTLN